MGQDKRHTHIKVLTIFPLISICRQSITNPGQKTILQVFAFIANMSTYTIQEQFNQYLDLLNKIHNIGHDIDASINEVEIKDLEAKRTALKHRLQMVTKTLVASLTKMESRYPIHNYLGNGTTYLYAENNKLMFEYH